MRRKLVSISAVLATALAGGLALPAASSAGPSHWTCSASALRLTSPLPDVEPVVANSPSGNHECASDVEGLLDVPIGTLGVVEALDAETQSSASGPTSSASITEMALNLPGAAITAQLLTSSATGRCTSPFFSGESKVLGFAVNGQGRNITGEPNQTIDAGPLVTLVVNEQFTRPDASSPNEFVVRALRVSSELLETDLVFAESIVGRDGHPCRTAPPPPQCSDGRDNDGDGRVDYPHDRQCSSRNDNDEHR